MILMYNHGWKMLSYCVCLIFPDSDSFTFYNIFMFFYLSILVTFRHLCICTDSVKSLTSFRKPSPPTLSTLILYSLTFYWLTISQASCILADFPLQIPAEQEVRLKVGKCATPSIISLIWSHFKVETSYQINKNNKN